MESMHSARLVALHSAMIALLIEYRSDQNGSVDAINCHMTMDEHFQTVDIQYMSHGVPVFGEGI